MREFSISRSYFYDLIKRIEKGDTVKIKKCLKKGHFACLWSFKYQPRYLCLPKNREKATIQELKAIIAGMKKDKFPIAQIAFLLGKKDRSTIIHHLK